MWLLPKLVSRQTSWELPLCEPTAGQLTSILLRGGNSADQLARLIHVLQADAPLVLWILCRARSWSTLPPSGWQDLACWLEANAAAELVALRPVPADGDERRLRQQAALAEKHCGSAPTGRPFCDQLAWRIGNPGRWMSCRGPEISTDRLRQEAAWWPAWLHDGPAEAECSPASGGDERWLQPNPVDSALSQLLPGVIDMRRALSVTRENDKLAALKQFAYGASHEINNPLANISTRAQALARDEADPERRRKLLTIVSQALRAHEMISDLMLFAKPPPRRCTSWDLAEVLEEVEQQYSCDAAHQGTKLIVEAGPGAIVHADRTQIAVAVGALVRNALEALGSGGQVEVQLTVPREEDGVRRGRIRVRDNGPGITGEVREHLFDPYFSGREAGRGLGFGLPKCWRIVTEHAGSLWVESQPGHGATFIIDLPLAEY